MVSGIALALVAGSFANSAFGYQAVQEAYAIAAGGAEDALLQITRNNQFAAPSGYSVAVGSSTATVAVTQGSPSSGYDTILSQGSVSLWTRKVQVVVAVNPTTGQASVVSWSEVQ